MARESGSGSKVIITILCVIIVGLMLFIYLRPHTAPVPAIATSQPQPPYYTAACPEQPQPMVFTADGYPVFNYNYCLHSTVCSTDGKNTFECPNDLSTIKPPVYASQRDPLGYQCGELADRYFHFRWNINLKGTVGGDLCPGAGGSWSPEDKARYTKDPVPGDIIVFSHESAESCGVNKQLGIAHHGHISLVRDVDGDIVTVVSEHWARPLSGVFTVPKNCACAYIHAVENTAPGGSVSQEGSHGKIQ